MDEDDVQLLFKYPLISCEINEGTKHYSGRILCGNHDLQVHVVENGDGRGNFIIKNSFGDEIDKNLANISAGSVTEFLDKIVNVVEQRGKAAPKNLTQTYKRVIQEYSEFTNFHLSVKRCNISTDLTKISVHVLDEGGREHCLEISVDLDETKDIFVARNLNLPEELTKDFSTKFSYITEIYTKFVATIEDLQLFFDVMDDLDRSCCILDPEQPTRRDCFRRIWLDQNLSVMVTVNPMNVRGRPELKFLGPEHIVEQCFEKLTNKLDEWDDSMDLFEGLLSILELEEFPFRPKQDQVALMDVGECSICYSLRLDEKLPEVICSNKSCENFYHIQCLYEWLASINSKRIFNQLHGQCPNCDKNIICPIP